MGVVSFQRTEDAALIRSIMTHPKIYPFFCDDEGPAREDWIPTVGARISWMLVRHDSEPVGVILVKEQSAYLWEMHLAFLPTAWGGLAAECVREFFRGVWRVSKCQRLYGPMVASNRLALKLAREVGAKEIGVHPRTYMKNGKLLDQILVAIDRPTEEGCEQTVPPATIAEVHAPATVHKG